MVPNVFVSSTIEDLLYLRDGVRDAILELEYIPVLSEHGGIGYLPTASAIDSCLIAMRQCQLAVVIIGKRYGQIDDAGLSAAHKEFRTARQEKVPVFCLIDREVLTFKRVFDSTQSQPAPNFPGMDNPKATFSLIQEFIDSAVNNGFIQYQSVSDARKNLKTQLAHLMGDLLRRAFDPITSDVKDVLSEIKTLRYYLSETPEAKKNQLRLLRGIRFVLDDRARSYKDLLEYLYPSVEELVIGALKERSFDDLISSLTGSPIRIDETPTTYSFSNLSKVSRWRLVVHGAAPSWFPETNSVIYYGILKEGGVVMNLSAATVFRRFHDMLHKAAEGELEPGENRRQ